MSTVVWWDADSWEDTVIGSIANDRLLYLHRRADTGQWYIDRNLISVFDLEAQTLDLGTCLNTTDLTVAKHMAETMVQIGGIPE